MPVFIFIEYNFNIVDGAERDMVQRIMTKPPNAYLGVAARNRRDQKTDMTQEKRTSPKKRAARLSPDDRRAHLRTVTLELLAQHGLGHTNHSMVAKRAGVSLPTMMHYYADHGDLVDDVLAEVANFLLNDIASRVAAQEPDPIMAVEEMLVSLARSIDTDQHIVRTWLNWSTATRHPAWPRYLAFREAACAIVAKKLNEGRAIGAVSKNLIIEEAAEVVVGLAHMITQMRFTGSTIAQTRLAVQHLLNGYLAGTAPSRFS